MPYPAAKDADAALGISSTPVKSHPPYEPTRAEEVFLAALAGRPKDESNNGMWVFRRNG